MKRSVIIILAFVGTFCLSGPADPQAPAPYQMSPTIASFFTPEERAKFAALGAEADAAGANADWTEKAALTCQRAELMASRLPASHLVVLVGRGKCAGDKSIDGDSEIAEIMMRELLSDAQRFGYQTDHPAVIEWHWNFGLQLDVVGRHREAIEQHRLAYAGAERLLAKTGFFDPQLRREAIQTIMVTSERLAYSLTQASKFEEGEQYYRRALESAIALEVPASVFVGHRRSALAANLMLQGRVSEASALVRQAEEAFLAYPSLDVQTQARFKIAADEAQHMDLDLALPKMLDALRYFESKYGADSAEIAGYLKTIAVVLARRERLTEAIPYAQRALENFSRMRGRSENTDAAQAATDLAAMQLAAGDNSDALSNAAYALEARLRLAQRGGPGARSRELSENYGMQSAATVFLHAALHAEPGSVEPERIFEAFQLARPSASSTSTLAAASRAAAERAGLGPQLEHIRNLDRQIGAIEQKLALSVGTVASVAASNANLAEQRAQLVGDRELSQRQLLNAIPQLEQLQAESIATLAETQALLRPDEVLLIPTFGRNGPGQETGFVLALTRVSWAWAAVDVKESDLVADIATLHASLSGTSVRAPALRRPMGGTQPFDVARAYRVYAALFASDDIARLASTKKRWILAPQGRLLALPFAALLIAEPSGTRSVASSIDFRSARWLGLERALSVTPSVSSFNTQRRQAQQQPNADAIRFFGLGDPSFSGAGTADKGNPSGADTQPISEFFRGSVASADTVRTLRQLPGTRTEIERLAVLFEAAPDDYVLDDKATEKEVRTRSADGRLAKADVIVFATHGLVAGGASSASAEPALALTPPPTGTLSENEDDGLLTAAEVASLRITASWVILSACDTAAGGKPDAEGLTGLARAFFFAGAGSLLVSQWRVNDEAAWRLTTHAVEQQRLARKSGVSLDNAEAMRLSMVALQKDKSRDGQAELSFAHPGAWAPFVVVGGS